MTPAQPPVSPPQQPYSMPTVALVLSIVGLCFCPLSIIGAILGLVALLRISKEPHLPGKGLAIAAMVVPLGLIPIVGIEAAIAIPNFIRFQARSKQSECKANLKGAWVSARAAKDEQGHWPTTFEELGWKPERGNRYSYFLSPGTVSAADVARFPSIAGEDHAAALGRVRFTPFTAACVGNVDNDPVLDVWWVSSEERTAEDGTTVPAGQLYNAVNDVTE